MRVFAALWLVVATAAFSQDKDAAKRVYESSQDSVFLVYLNDSTGSPSALGSAFLAAPRTLITNAHVASAGRPFLAVGPARIPLKVVRVDQENDLAVLSTDVDLTSNPLPLATSRISPGEQVFAIGNPEGLEKTISQGIVSGVRKEGDRSLLQITCPISHGSSGGPILNSKGEVVAVAVAILPNGQNLNFAVPVDYVRSILESKVETPVRADVKTNLAKLNQLLDSRSQLTYSNDASSDYQQATKEIISLMDATTRAADSDEELTEVACMGTRTEDISEAGIRAARKLVADRPSAGNRALLSFVLLDRADDEGIDVAFAKEGSEEQTNAKARQGKYLSEASELATEISRTARGNTLQITDFVLGGVADDKNDYSAAISWLSHTAEGSTQLCNDDLAERSLRTLINDSNQLSHPDDAEKWFRHYASLYKPGPSEWNAEGDRRSNANDFAGAADAWERAAEGSQYLSYDYCYAAVDRSITGDRGSDAVLDDGRKCVDASVQQNTEHQEDFKKEVPVVYREMSSVLEGRGAYPSALEYIKESLAAGSDDPFALSLEAKIFADLERNSECIAAAQAAIRVSDGKYPEMQFQLGYCYFATENWSQAATSFRIAAEADSTDSVSAFNLGLCLLRQGFDTDAQHWFQEALKRNPDNELRAKILGVLK